MEPGNHPSLFNSVPGQWSVTVLNSVEAHYYTPLTNSFVAGLLLTWKLEQRLLYLLGMEPRTIN